MRHTFPRRNNNFGKNCVMNVIVNDTGFHPAPPKTQTLNSILHLAPDHNTYPDHLNLNGIPQITINFADFSDGRGFTMARRLRNKGYRGGALQASGYLLADQYAMARRSGFDDIEISDAMAAHQPQDHWLFRAGWQQNDHRSRLFC